MDWPFSFGLTMPDERKGTRAPIDGAGDGTLRISWVGNQQGLKARKMPGRTGPPPLEGAGRGKEIVRELDWISFSRRGTPRRTMLKRCGDEGRPRMRPSRGHVWGEGREFWRERNAGGWGPLGKIRGLHRAWAGAMLKIRFWMGTLGGGTGREMGRVGRGGGPAQGRRGLKGNVGMGRGKLFPPWVGGFDGKKGDLGFLVFPKNGREESTWERGENGPPAFFCGETGFPAGPADGGAGPLLLESCWPDRARGPG